MRIGEAWAGLNKPHTHIPSSALDSWLFTSQILNKQASPGPVKCQGNHPLRVPSSVSCQVFLALSADLLNSGLLLPHSSILGKLTTYIHTQREREALLYPAQVRVAHNLHVTHHWGRNCLLLPLDYLCTPGCSRLLESLYYLTLRRTVFSLSQFSSPST